MRGIQLVALALMVLSVGCNNTGKKYVVVDANSHHPLQGVVVSRYSSRDSMVLGFSDNRGKLPLTDAAGRTDSGAMLSKYPYSAYRFDFPGYSPARVVYSPGNPKGEFVLYSPWNGDARSGRPIVDTPWSMIPLQRLPESQRNFSTLASLPAIPDEWDGVWRFQAVDGMTGLFISGVKASYYRSPYGQQPNAVLLTGVTDENGLIAKQLPVPSAYIDVVFEKEGFLTAGSSTNRNSAVVWVSTTDRFSQSNREATGSLSARTLITIPLYRIGAALKEWSASPKEKCQ